MSIQAISRSTFVPRTPVQRTLGTQANQTSDSGERLVGLAFSGACFVPVVGTLSSMAAGITCSNRSDETGMSLASKGALLNAAGSVMLGVGAFTGGVPMLIGVGALAVGGICGAAAWSRIPS